MQKTFLVLGATGTVGGAVSRQVEAFGQKVIRVGHLSHEPGVLQCNVANHCSVYNLAVKVSEMIGEGKKLDGAFFGVSRHRFAEFQHALHKPMTALEQAPALAEMFSAEVSGMMMFLQIFCPSLLAGAKFAMVYPTFSRQGFGDPVFWEALERDGINLRPWVAIKRAQFHLARLFTEELGHVHPIEAPAMLIAERPLTGTIPEGLPSFAVSSAHSVAATVCQSLLQEYD